MQSCDLKVRLPADLHQWVADEALRGRHSMNAVVVEAVDLLKATRAERRAHERHVAAIELAISVTQLPMGTAIIMQTDYLELKTDILVRAPSDQE
ncbi:MAG TPA: hypothetical protein VKG78_11145 [Opitutaceae bacterium]|nr:hypothetical protein [Opitutaceae bacterium]